VPLVPRIVALFFLHLLAATLGPAAVESLLWSVVGQPHSISTIESAEWILSVGSAAAIAYVVCRKWPSQSALLVWTVPLVALLFRLATYSSSSTEIWQHFLRPDCAKDISECKDFLLVTVLTIRALTYSAAAWIFLIVGGAPAGRNLNGPATKKR